MTLKPGYRFGCACLALLALVGGMSLLSREAQAFSRPGLTFTVEFEQDYVPLPADYKMKSAAIYEGSLKVLDLWQRLKAMKAARLNELQTHRADKSLDAVTRGDKVREVERVYQEAQAAIQNEREGVRAEMVWLLENEQRKACDPYGLLWLAQLSFTIRHDPLSVLRERVAKLEAEAKAKAADVAAQAVAPEAAPAPPAPAPDAALQGCKTIDLPLTSHVTRMTALLEELRERFPQFDKMEYVLHLLGELYLEQGVVDKSHKVWAEIECKHKSSPFFREALIHLGDHEFDNPTAYDHFTLAADYYTRALSLYKPPAEEYYRLLYRRAWATYLSPELSEDAMDTFRGLYKAVMAAPGQSEEMLAMKAEALGIARQINAISSQDQGRESFQY